MDTTLLLGAFGGIAFMQVLGYVKSWYERSIKAEEERTTLIKNKLNEFENKYTSKLNEYENKYVSNLEEFEQKINILTNNFINNVETTCQRTENKTSKLLAEFIYKYDYQTVADKGTYKTFVGLMNDEKSALTKSLEEANRNNLSHLEKIIEDISNRKDNILTKDKCLEVLRDKECRQGDVCTLPALDCDDVRNGLIQIQYLE